LFAVRSAQRDALRQALLSRNIDCGIHYPVPLHLQPACRDLGYRRGDFSESEKLADTELSLPMHPHLTDSEVDRTARALIEALEEGQTMFAGGPGPDSSMSIPPPEGGE
jgi:dTDP-4-amino-4,6-dideoxygalactose transaminase